MILDTCQPSREYWYLVLVGAAILPAPAVPASTGISVRLKRVANGVGNTVLGTQFTRERVIVYTAALAMRLR